MTKKHRYMTLRDDVVFFIFMYQRYLYKVDPTRADEFGYVHSQEEAAVARGEIEGVTDLKERTRREASFEIYVDKAAKYRWRLKTFSCDIILISTKGHDSEASC